MTTQPPQPLVTHTVDYEPSSDMETITDALVLAQELESQINAFRKRCKIRSAIPDMLGDVAKFHEAAGIPKHPQPVVIPVERQLLREKLIKEEYAELKFYVERIKIYCAPNTGPFQKDMVGIADGICDLIYVLLGTALEFGIPIHDCWREVQRTNMDKFRTTYDPVTGNPNPQVRADGKVLKPTDWQPPNLQDILFPKEDQSTT